MSTNIYKPTQTLIDLSAALDTAGVRAANARAKLEVNASRETSGHGAAEGVATRQRETEKE